MNTPQLLGAAAAVVLVGGWVAWERLRPAPCSGGVFIEFHPPLEELGRYHFRLSLEGADKPCEFEVPLPLPLPAAAQKPPCHMALDLRTTNESGKVRITGLTFGASPKRFALQVKHDSELVYDTSITPTYTPYPMKREESKRFCGEQAFVKPACLRGSSACTPFAATCGPEAPCPKKKVCCASPEWGMDYGPLAATDCSSERRCLDRLGHIVCRSDADCPKDMACEDASMRGEYKPPLMMCQPRK